MSFERILSAGDSGPALPKQVSNYYIAQSKSKKEWQEYINRADKPFLYMNKFGKTIIEYAIEFQNYVFIKFLMDKHCIWFDSGRDKDYVITFGAGAKIQGNDSDNCENDSAIYTRNSMNHLHSRLTEDDRLRIQVIPIACDNRDLKMLGDLRAREIPGLYFRANYLSCSHPEVNSHYAASVVKRIPIIRYWSISPTALTFRAAKIAVTKTGENAPSFIRISLSCSTFLSRRANRSQTARLKR